VILIVGGSGVLGTLVTRRLLAVGESVRVMSRTPARTAGLRAAGAEVVAGDLLDRQSLMRACAGADMVVAATHSILGRGSNASIHVDGAGHRQLIDIARAGGVRRIVYTSVYDYGPAYQSIPFFRIKYEVEEHLKTSGVAYTIVRPTAFMDFHAHELIGKPILAKGKVVLFGRGERRRNFVAADDVAQVVVASLRDGSLAGETIDVGGPEDLTHMDVVRLYERLTGRAARVTHLPLGAVRALVAVVRPLHPGLSQILQAAVLADTADQRFDSGGSARVPTQRTRLEDWASRQLALGAPV
jgi:uncharacterized protein YbjT (DUF2867 family)